MAMRITFYLTNLVFAFLGIYKMNRLIYLLLITLFCSVQVQAQTISHENEPDSFSLEEIIVTGTMPKVNLKTVPMSISVVSGITIENRLQSSLLPLLSEEVPGLFITQRGVMGFGVAEGSAGSMSIRGIGGTPTSGVLVLIDGHPQYMGLMGHPLADSYQSMITERVEVIRGPASMLYGSNAMGGVINIITKKQKTNGKNLLAQVMYGSYNSLITEVTGGFRKNQIHANGNIGLNRSDGHRENMEFEQINGNGNLGYDFTENWTGFVDFNISKTLSSNPGSIKNPYINNDADILRGVASAVIENEYKNTSGAVKFYYNFGSHYINNGYPRNSSSIKSYFHSKDQMLGFSANQSYSLFDGNKTTVGFDFLQFGGNAWNELPDFEDIPLVDIHLNNYAGYINIQQSVLDKKLTMNAGIRLDHHDKNGSEWIPQFGVSYLPTQNTTIKGIVSKGFRNPTIREMYMFQPKNSNLKPEQLMNYEISLLQSFPEERLNLGVNVFYINGDNLIRLNMVEGKPLYVNTGKVENKGIELTVSYNATDDLKFSTNYSYLKMTHIIAGVPEHKLYFGGNYSFKKWNVSMGLQYLGHLYTTINPNIVKVNALIWNARINYSLLNWMNLFLRGENLLGQEYEINAGFPMPKTTVFGGIQIHI